MLTTNNNWFIVKSGCASVYQEADFNSSCLTEAIYGESCQILDQNGNWIRIRCEDGYMGWVNEFYGEKSLKTNNPTHLIVFPNENGIFNSKFPFGSMVNQHQKGAVRISEMLGFDQVIPIARNLLGTPYKWGGKTSLGIDCSGLVQSVLKVCGLMIPRDSHEQFNYFAKDEIQLDQAKPGDLHFFGGDGKVTHVGFSLGEKGILHSQGYVKVESLDPSDENVNFNLIDMYMSTHSIQCKFRP